jgi:small-conductance mechanosensitive channel
MGNLEQFLFDVADPRSGLELVALLISVLVAAGLSRWWGREADQDSILFGKRIIDGLLFPMLTLVIVYFLKMHWVKTHHAPWLSLAVPILASLAMVRLIARVLSVVFPQSAGARAVERGVFWLVWGVAVLWITGVAEPLVTELDSIQFEVGKTHFTLLHAIQATLASGVALIMTLWLSAVLEQKLLMRTISDLSMRKVATNALRAVLMVVGGIVVLSLMGVDLTALSVMGGAVGVGLGFGLQKLAANYISGFVLLLERSIRIGDYVRVEKVEGRVTDIKTRFTLIQAINGSEAVVPNETMITQLVENLSLQSSNFQLSCVYMIALGSDVEQTQALLVDAATRVDEVLKIPGPSALLLEVTPLGLRFQVGFWIQDASKGQGIAKSKVNMAVLAALKQAHIELSQAPQGSAWMAQHGPTQ